MAAVPSFPVIQNSITFIIQHIHADIVTCFGLTCYKNTAKYVYKHAEFCIWIKI